MSKKLKILSINRPSAEELKNVLSGNRGKYDILIFSKTKEKNYISIYFYYYEIYYLLLGLFDIEIETDTGFFYFDIKNVGEEKVFDVIDKNNKHQAA